MRQIVFLGIFLTIASTAFAQQNLTPEMLWKLGRISPLGISKDGKNVIYSVSNPNAAENKSNKTTYMLPIAGGNPVIVVGKDSLLATDRISPDGKYIISSEEVKVKPVYGSDFYPELPKSNVQIYDNLDYRHWDTWEDGKFGHVMVAPLVNGKPGVAKDIMPNEPYDCPTKPDGDEKDFIWSPDSKKILYVTKKKFGTAYANSTNTDLYEYDVETGTTKDLTEDNKGYDVAPQYSKQGQLAWLQMKRDGYESDKNDLVVMGNGYNGNITEGLDKIHVENFKWSNDGNSIYFVAPVDGTLQLFAADFYKGPSGNGFKVHQISKGDFDITSVVGQVGNTLIVTRTDFNHAAELYKLDITSGSLAQLSHVNDAMYANINQITWEKKMVTTTDNKEELVWVVYPPNFDKTKKYPTLLYCQGGPQSPLTQFYSFRWSMQLMASNGYIIVAPNRRGMPGHGTAWNEEISKDHGGQAIQDYLSAIDAASKESYVDKSRLGCVGASYGGYSVYMLAGIHNKRFKTFIAHDGIFDLRSFYGTTEEVWFPQFDYGGAYWDKTNAAAQKTYNKFSPSDYVGNWDTPILIYSGGKDYRVPQNQAFQAFQAAQLLGIKSKFVYLPDQNHWVSTSQDALVWQHEFFKWLKETL